MLLDWQLATLNQGGSYEQHFLCPIQLNMTTLIKCPDYMWPTKCHGVSVVKQNHGVVYLITIVILITKGCLQMCPFIHVRVTFSLVLPAAYVCS